MLEQFTAQFEKAAPAAKTKECSMCGLFKPLSDYSFDRKKLRPNCKLCNANRHVTCGGCHIKRPEADMKIYSVPENKYYCNQPCKDKHDGVKHDQEGYIVERNRNGRIYNED